MISLELLPAAHGDALWIEYGTGEAVHRILIDGGPAPTYENGLRRRIAALPENQRELELMVVTHIDADHIDGSLIMLQELPSLKVRIKELWFNGWQQLGGEGSPEVFAPLQGEFLGGLIKVDEQLKSSWNKYFHQQAQQAAAISKSDVPEAVAIPKSDVPEQQRQVLLDGGAKLTLLGPTAAEIKRLRARWAAAIRDFSPGDAEEALRRLRERREYQPPSTPAVFAVRQYGDDQSPANGSSIAFILEYKGIALLLAGDAHARTLAESLKSLASQGSKTKMRFDAVKLPHHGSMNNVNDAWLALVDCDNWLISTNGAVFNHPDKETAELIARHCQKPPTLHCNYRNPKTEEKLVLKDNDQRWKTAFPEGETQGPAGGLKMSWPTNP